MAYYAVMKLHVPQLPSTQIDVDKAHKHNTELKKASPQNIIHGMVQKHAKLDNMLLKITSISEKT